MDAGDESALAETFEVLGDGTRIEILRALAASWNERGIDEYARSFSQLRKAADVSHSSRFNYHLQQLTDDFLVKTADGYEFTSAGWRLVKTILDASDHETPPVEPFEMPGTCPLCGDAALAGRYVHDWVWITCSACENHVTDVLFPANGFAGRSPSAVAEACDCINRNYVRLLADGACPECLGDLHRRVAEVTWGEWSWTRFVFDCTVCSHRTNPPLGSFLLDHPEVVAFYRRRGIDLETEYYWTFGPAVGDDATETLSEEPWRFRVTMPAPDGELQVTVDEKLNVIKTVEDESRAHDTGYPASAIATQNPEVNP